MEDCHAPGCSKVDPYDALYIACWNSILSSNDKVVNVGQLMTLCIKETSMAYFWSGSEVLYGYNKAELLKNTGITPFKMERLIALNASPSTRGRISKWKFEISWWKEIIHRADYASFSVEEKAAFACSWGIAQKSGYYYTADLHVQDKLPALQIFCRNPQLQHLTLVKDVHMLSKQSHGSDGIMFSKYNGGPGVEHVTEYGNVSLGIQVHVNEWLRKRGKKTCLV